VKKQELQFHALLADQSAKHKVFVFKARAVDVLRIAEIDRAGRTVGGRVKGFQRPQIASHIAHIQEYLNKADAVLPNALVVAFLTGIRIDSRSGGFAKISIDVSSGKPGYVVDGQQRLTALSKSNRKDFEVFVIGIKCTDYDELRKQFILVNSTRPLPKSLIYELLPTIGGINAALQSRSLAAGLTEMLNYDSRSSLAGMIRTHTNPTGVVKDTALHKVIMASSSDGAIREFMLHGDAARGPFELLSNFYGAVQDTFPEAWRGHTPKTSRLVHGTGVVALGYVMEALFSRTHRADRDAFGKGMAALKGHTAWTSGVWRFAKNDVVPWNRLQNIRRHVMNLTQFLLAHLKRGAQRTAPRRQRRRRRHA
jgi:DGQHR domain-containing protein